MALSNEYGSLGLLILIPQVSRGWVWASISINWFHFAISRIKHFFKLACEVIQIFLGYNQEDL